MKKFTISLLLTIGVMFVLQTKTFAAEADKEIAVALVQKVAVLIKEKGKDEVFEMINNKNSNLVDGDKYIFVNNFENVCVAHGANARLTGRDFSKLKDANGVFFIAEMGKVAQEKNSGWVNYRWSNPKTKKVQNKATYVEKVEGEELYIGCGIYVE